RGTPVHTEITPEHGRYGGVDGGEHRPDLGRARGRERRVALWMRPQGHIGRQISRAAQRQGGGGGAFPPQRRAGRVGEDRGSHCSGGRTGWGISWVPVQPYSTRATIITRRSRRKRC